MRTQLFKTENYFGLLRFFGLAISYKSKQNTVFRKMDLIPSSGKSVRRHILSWARQEKLNSVTGSRGTSGQNQYLPETKALRNTLSVILLEEWC
jgi:hypothetical protein